MTQKTSALRIVITLTGAVACAVLAVLLTLAKAALLFPPIPYLQVNFAEIPVFIALFLLGPAAAIIASVIHWLFFSMQGNADPLGSTLKLAAELSTVAGFWLGSVFYQHIKRNKPRPTIALSMMFGWGAVLRVAAMTVINYVVLLYVAPSLLQQLTGLASEATVLVYALFFTAIYNVVNLLVGAVPASLIVSPIMTSFNRITSIETWLARNVRK